MPEHDVSSTQTEDPRDSIASSSIGSDPKLLQEDVQPPETETLPPPPQQRLTSSFPPPEEQSEQIEVLRLAVQLLRIAAWYRNDLNEGDQKIPGNTKFGWDKEVQELVTDVFRIYDAYIIALQPPVELESKSPINHASFLQQLKKAALDVTLKIRGSYRFGKNNSRIARAYYDLSEGLNGRIPIQFATTVDIPVELKAMHGNEIDADYAHQFINYCYIQMPQKIVNDYKNKKPFAQRKDIKQAAVNAISTTLIRMDQHLDPTKTIHQRVLEIVKENLQTGSEGSKKFDPAFTRRTFGKMLQDLGLFLDKTSSVLEARQKSIREEPDKKVRARLVKQLKEDEVQAIDAIEGNKLKL